MIKFLQGTSTELSSQSLTDTIAFETDTSCLLVNGVNVYTKYAQHAQQATNAFNASSALTANAASVCDNARCDKEGNLIHETYLKRGLLLDLVYPIGSIYMSMRDTHPSMLFGGEWQSISETFLFAATDPQSDALAYVGGDTGGSNDAVVVNHTHAFVGTGGAWDNVSQWGLFRAGSSEYANPSLQHGSYGSSDGYISIANTGADGSRKNMPEYLVVYMWQRIE